MYCARKGFMLKFNTNEAYSMFFQSYIFILAFLPICVIGYFTINHYKQYRAASTFLLVMSLVFYGWFNASFLPIIIVSIAVNYLCGTSFHSVLQPSHRKLIFILGIVFNIGLLVYFKYSNFFIENINALFSSNIGALKLILPLGISFFTFQQLSFLIDSYKGKAAKYHFIDYSLFASFFPYVVSGPIAFHDEIIPQICDTRRRTFCFENFSRGMTSFSIGLFKKVIVADTLAAAADWGFSNISGINTTTAFVVILCYTFQLYFDFSGYCDMARGAAYMLNIKLPQNFDSPYQAITITDFWKRWHMTMTRFFTKYVYIPLGGSRKGTARTYINTMIIFLVSGLWHGANWTFIVWGAMHGLALILCKLFAKQIGKIKPLLSWALTFIFINITWVFFRAPTLDSAFEFCQKLFSYEFGAISREVMQCFMSPFARSLFTSGYLPCDQILATCCVWFIALCFIATVQAKSSYSLVENFKPTTQKSIFFAIIFFVSIISIGGVTTFLYFNF